MSRTCNVCEKEAMCGCYIFKGNAEEIPVCFDCIKRLYIQAFGSKAEPREITRKGISESLRDKVFERDDYKCKFCGGDNNLCLDHIKPFSHGGKTELDNIQTLCRQCNSKKSNKR